MSETPKEMKLEIHADEATAQGVYTNFIVGNYGETEFVLDFIFVAPGVPKAKVLSRVILNPTHAKRLTNLLVRQVTAYEQRFGTIEERSGSPGFKGHDESGSLVN